MGISKHFVQFTVFASLLTAFLLTGCKDTRDPVVRENVQLTESLDIFERPILPSANPASPQQPVATVNGQPVSRGALEREAKAIAVRLRNQLPPERIEQEKDKILNQALNNLIIRVLLRDSIEKEQIEVDASEVENAITQIKENLPVGTSFSDFLSNSGVSEVALRENIEIELRVQELVKANVGDVPPPSDEEIQTFYDENPERFKVPERVNAEHILVAIPKEATFGVTQERTALARTLHDSVEGGKSIADVLAEYSDSDIVRGGPVTFARGQIDPGLEKVLFALKPDELSDVSSSPLGLHIFHAKEILPAGTVELEEVKDRVSQALQQSETQKRINEYLQSLRENADINVMN